MGTQKNRPESVNNAAPSKPGTPMTDCVRCGTCCEKGGPGFHQEDRMLIETGIIPSKCLYTIRKGELAYDNIKQCMMSLDSDIIKIKGKADSWTCIFFDEINKACTIYEDRPLECRTLKCWDTREIEKLYARKRLSRNDLISQIAGLWDLIEDHQARCDYQEIQRLVKELTVNQRSKDRQKLLEIIQYDNEIRKLVVSRGGLDPEMLDFLFGRPLMQTIENYGFEVRQEGQKIRLVRSLGRGRKAHVRGQGKGG